jgi:hypothetical protein
LLSWPPLRPSWATSPSWPSSTKSCASLTKKEPRSTRP